MSCISSMQQGQGLVLSHQLRGRRCPQGQEAAAPEQRHGQPDLTGKPRESGKHSMSNRGSNKNNQTCLKSRRQGDRQMLPWLSRTPLTLYSKAKNIKVEFTKTEAPGENCTQKSSLLFTSFNPKVLQGEHLDITSLLQNEIRNTWQCCVAEAVLHAGLWQPVSCGAIMQRTVLASGKGGFRKRMLGTIQR